MDFVFLGTGAGVPAKARNVSSIVLQLLEERKTIWMFDCGEATQHQILKTAVKPSKIEKIFITHLHGDHIFGLPGLLSSRSFQGGKDELTVYGPRGIREYILTSLAVSCTNLKYELIIEEIDEGIIFEDDTFYVEARKLEHGIASYGYRIVEKDRPGELQVEALLQLGITPGPIFKRIKAGETVELADGTVLNGKEFVGDPKKGRIITILGDTRSCENSKILARDCDYLVHEATFASGNEEMAYDYFHSTTTQAAGTAVAAQAKQLILTHISSRYMKEDTESLLQEATAIFPNTVIAEDLMRLSIEKR
ncbi:ribonuclease Z [Bacillus sp. AGMB 02131]|uniref:Ribonuclease Z n=1 Tax=Peribacillus faecalis TaxID=2772559 RepID=A0A927CYX3_9BACI|nr:ribonuclease Z [Peribacillus faecalis]MBD3109571.1 ribonuclease Z [Peribacillus faecalis]